MRVTGKVFINRDVDEVFVNLTSPSTESRWRRSVLEGVLDTSGDLREGSRGRFRMRFMGREVDAPWEIVEFVDGVRLRRVYVDGVRGGSDLYRLEPFGRGATVLEAEVEVSPDGLAGLLVLGRRSSMDQELRADLRRLKEIVEGGAPA